MDLVLSEVVHRKLVQNTITSNDQNMMHGEIASPGQLKKELEVLRSRYRLLLTVVMVLISLAAASFFSIAASDKEDLKAELKEELRQEMLIQLKGELSPEGVTDKGASRPESVSSPEPSQHTGRD